MMEKIWTLMVAQSIEAFITGGVIHHNDPTDGTRPFCSGDGLG
jgi:hypothetical protein